MLPDSNLKQDPIDTIGNTARFKRDTLIKLSNISELLIVEGVNISFKELTEMYDVTKHALDSNYGYVRGKARIVCKQIQDVLTYKILMVLFCLAITTMLITSILDLIKG
jgi:hypothetical protein